MNINNNNKLKGSATTIKQKNSEYRWKCKITA